MYNIFKVLETLGSDEEKIEFIADTLEQNGIPSEDRPLKRYDGVININYTKPGVDAVFCVIYKPKSGELNFTLIDYDLYDKYVLSDPRLRINTSERNKGDKKIIFNSKNFNNSAVHRLAVGQDCKGKQVDHIPHEVRLNIKMVLRVCNAWENRANRRFYSNVASNKKSFSIRLPYLSESDKNALLSKNYRVVGDGVYKSPKFNNADEMYKEINLIETKYVGEFRYNPLLDFSETWYALVLYKMLGIISYKELLEYNKDYMIRNHKDIAEYYQLL